MSEDFSSYDFSKIPFEDIVSVGQRTLIYRDIFNVSWLLGRYCNYSCSYCWPYARSDVKDHRPLPLLIKTMDEIKRQARENGFNSFHFSFSGGEPTVHPNFLELIEHYQKDQIDCHYLSTHMTTNLSRSIKWFEKYADITESLSRVSVTASWHREMAKKESFRDKIILLQERDIHVTINMVMVPSMFEDYYKEAMFFHEAGINVTLKPQSNLSATKVVEGYTKEQRRVLHTGLPQRDYTHARLEREKIVSKRPPYKKRQNFDTPRKKGAPLNFQVEMKDKNEQVWYLDQAERLNAFEFNKFKGWKCHAGYQGIVIREPDGSIRRGYSCTDEPLGYIGESFNIFNRPTSCVSGSCVSSVDSKMPKFKDEYI